jgi:cyclopropane-fatty-acyl-phospholipid synthase
MKSSSLSVSRLSTNGLTGSLLRRGVLRQLAQLKNGQLLVVEDGERLIFGTPGSTPCSARST